MRFFLLKITAVFVVLLMLGGCAKAGEEMLATYRGDMMSGASDGPEADALHAAEQSRPEDVSQAADSETVIQTIYVYVCGEVVSPGVYALQKEARVVDAINAAGGLCPEADVLSLNQARPLVDGEQITVKKIGETAAEGEDLPGGMTADGRININTADVSMLQTLPGIGEVKAQAIVDYREAQGAFGSIEDIRKVDGIGEALFQKLKKEITTG